MLVDGSGRVGRGVAYSTTEGAHLLNVRADGLCGWAGVRQLFAKRFASEGGDPRGFAERRLFGRYLGEILDEAIATGCVQVTESTAVNASRDGHGWRVALGNGATIEADALVLAVGNQEPEGLGAFSQVGSRFVRNPWGDEARAAVHRGALATRPDSPLSRRLRSRTDRPRDVTARPSRPLPLVEAAKRRGGLASRGRQHAPA